MTSISVDINNSFYKSVEGNLYNKDGTTLIKYAVGKNDAEFVIPSDVINIISSAFLDCKSLESIIIPNSVIYIGYGAFSGCSSLINVIIPNGITEISNYTFLDCINLTNIVIPKSVMIIKDYAFENCEKLTIYCESTSMPMF